MTLLGHLLPGTFFIFFGVWWSFGTAVRFVLSKQRSPFKKNWEPVGYRSTVTIPCMCLPMKILRRMPVESIFKLFCATIGILAELYTGGGWRKISIPMGKPSHSHEPATATLASLVSATQHIHDHQMHDHAQKRDITEQQTKFFNIYYWGVGMGYMQHVTMYSGFALGALVEILMHFGYELPSGMDYAFGAFAFTVEAFIFNSHLHGKGMVDAFLHVLLVWAICGCILGSICEYVSRKNVAFAYGRCLFTILQGTWFYQVGLATSYDPMKWEDTHDNMMRAAIFFCWHTFFIMIGL
jgi:hypothetical protein